MKDLSHKLATDIAQANERFSTALSALTEALRGEIAAAHAEFEIAAANRHEWMTQEVERTLGVFSSGGVTSEGAAPHE